MRNVVLLVLFSASSLFANTANQWLTPDLLLVKSPPRAAARQVEWGNCRDLIPKLVCVVEGGRPGDLDRDCLPGGAAYVAEFEKVFDALPPAYQKMFCSLRRINIEMDLESTGYTTIEMNGSSLAPPTMGLRKSILDDHLSLAHLVSWKEQLSFGGDPSDKYLLTPGLPVVSSHTDRPVNDLLFYVIAHEFGHMFDFSNGLNQCATLGLGEECISQGGWTKFSWETSKKARSEDEFKGRAGLCFYHCSEYIAAMDVAPLYQALQFNSNFITTYSSTSIWDDLAESFGFYALDYSLKSSYIVSDQRGNSYDLIQKLHSAKFQEKYKYVSEFLNRKDIVYPQ